MTDIIKLARLIEEISYDGNTKKYKDYAIKCAISEGTITEGDADKLKAEYCTPDRCDNPWNYRYTIVYWGKLFEGDVPNDWNETGCHDLSCHWDWITYYGQNMEITVYDNEYGVRYNTVSNDWD